MTPASGGGQPVVLSAEETAMVRRALAACSRMLTWASDHGGPQAGQLLADMTRQLASGRSASRQTRPAPGPAGRPPPRHQPGPS